MTPRYALMLAVLLVITFNEDLSLWLVELVQQQQAPPR